MLLRDLPVREFMTTDVLTFRRDDNVQFAMRTLVTREIDAAPILDEEGYVVGSLSTGDLIVEEARIPLPAVITLLGGVLELPKSRKQYEHDLDKALGATVGEVMQAGVPATLSPDDTLETAATLMHDEDLDRIPVVDEGGFLVGLVSRGDIVRAIVKDLDSSATAEPAGDTE
jgi:CBS domain-containing protein